MNGGTMMRVLDEWLARPRMPFIRVVPRLRFLQALWVFPYICTVGLIAFLIGSEDAGRGDVIFLTVFAIVAAIETVFLLLWLRRPVARQ